MPFHMIHAPEMIAIERRAHEARVSLPTLCKRAGIFPSSWYRARKRGSANYTLIDPIEKALAQVEREREELK